MMAGGGGYPPPGHSFRGGIPPSLPTALFSEGGIPPSPGHFCFSRGEASPSPGGWGPQIANSPYKALGLTRPLRAWAAEIREGLEGLFGHSSGLGRPCGGVWGSYEFVLLKLPHRSEKYSKNIQNYTNVENSSKSLFQSGVQYGCLVEKDRSLVMHHLFLYACAAQ